MMKFFFLLPLCCVLASCGGKDDAAGDPPPPIPVQVAAPVVEEVALTRIFTGRFVATERVEVRARVSGYLESVSFAEGQRIEKGETMFQIDSRLFDADVARAQAALEQAEAALKLAEQNSTRAEGLIKRNAISREEVDIRLAESQSAAADLAAAKAGLQTAQLNRSYADIEAPITGIAGSYRVTPGNYVSGGNPTSAVLTTIVPHSPIYCEFEVDERQVLQFTRMYFKGKTRGRSGDGPMVQIGLSDTDTFDFEGQLDFGDNELEASTATLRMRATVENENEFLTPGLFARVKLPIGDPSEKMLVRDSALGFDQARRFCWVLKKDATLEKRYVETGELIGALRIIESGLEAQEKVAISGIQLLRPGVPVQPIDAAMKEAQQ